MKAKLKTNLQKLQDLYLVHNDKLQEPANKSCSSRQTERSDRGCESKKVQKKTPLNLISLIITK